tara:strand:+ start:408 stop:1379 length:972 start_codon:yes stop_codon:yes gene_type:complete
MNIVNYLLVFIAVTTIGMLYDRYNKKFYPDEELDKYNLVRKYLLNESESMTSKPFIWLHSKHVINSRNWASFNGRSSRDLNQPYKDLCVESVIKNCGENFKICLIDDSSFERLLPDWTISMDGLSEPIKDRVRVLAISKLLYLYGGVLMPNSTVMMKDMKSLYDNELSNKGLFVGELLNKSGSNKITRFFPSYKFMGCHKNSLVMKELIEYLEILISKDNTDMPNFDATINRYLFKLINDNKCSLINGKKLGVKDNKNNVILIDNWLENTNLDICLDSLLCVVLPDEEILSRTKYQWFARLNKKQVLKANTMASKYILISHNK